MSGALGSVFGGGNILGSLLSIASIAFPPLAIAGSMGNLLTQAVGAAVKMAADTLVKEHGMPKFLGELVNGVVDQAVSKNTNETNPAADKYVQDKHGAEIEQFTKDTAEEITNKAVAKMAQQGLEDSDEGKSKAKSGGKKGAGSWLEAIARAMGDVLGEKAAKMVELSNKIAKNVGNDGEDAAKENAALTTEMQATSQMFSLMQNGFTNAIKSIGEGLSQAARKG